MLHRFCLTALLLGGLFGCLPQSQIPPAPPEGPDPVEAPALDFPDISGEWIVESGDGKIRQLWTLQLVGNTLTGEFTTDPETLEAGLSEPTRPVQGRVVGVGTTWGVRLETPTNGLISIQSAQQFTFCPGPGNPEACRVARRKGASPAPAPSGVPSGRPPIIYK